VAVFSKREILQPRYMPWRHRANTEYLLKDSSFYKTI